MKKHLLYSVLTVLGLMAGTQAASADDVQTVETQIKITYCVPLTDNYGLQACDYLREGCEYDTETHTITYPAIDDVLFKKIAAVDASVTSIDSLSTSQFVRGWNYRWGGAGYWKFLDFSDYEELVIEFAEPCAYAVTLLVQGDSLAADDGGAKTNASERHTVQVTVPAGSSSVSLNLRTAVDTLGNALTEEELENIEYIRLRLDYPAAEGGTLKLSKAYLTQTVTIPTESDEMFPLTEDGLNIDIWDPNYETEWNADTKALKTGAYCVAGWAYGPDYGEDYLNLSGYDYLIAELQEPQQTGLRFRVWDNGFWNYQFDREFSLFEDEEEATKLTIDLNNMQKTTGSDDDIQYVDPSRITIVGFWSLGDDYVYIKRVYVKKLTETEGIAEVEYAPLKSTKGVYDLSGRKVSNPTSGLYIKDGRKVIINK